MGKANNCGICIADKIMPGIPTTSIIDAIIDMVNAFDMSLLILFIVTSILLYYKMKFISTRNVYLFIID